MALSMRPLRSTVSVCAACARQQRFSRRQFVTTSTFRFEDVRSESRLPRVATPSFWTSLVPKVFRRTREPTIVVEGEGEGEIVAPIVAAPKERRRWNPYTTFIILAVLIGSNAIQLISLRNEMTAFTRQTDAKLELLREVVKKVRRGEINDEEVKRALGTGDPVAEKEWERVVKEVEETNVLWEAQKRRERTAEERRMEAERRGGNSPVSEVDREGGKGEERRDGRVRFLM
ncbi:hypothetical protein LTR62_005479 [Meristemomyces frigidus]|uniref:Uncharacterized protein n=1 Tax=Meristemomyces frigidus TaxID=1508187 RepID=A0AAN7YFB7_9PEZI|nr:hypothetical protein LTR62_005479 [Meristemomyces frigidus]